MKAQPINAPVLFVAADPRECKCWVERWEDVRTPALPVHWARAGRWRGNSMIAVANGAGWDRAAAAVRAIAKEIEVPRAIYNIGFCGAADESLKIGDIFVPTEVRGAGRQYRVLPPAGPAAVSGVMASAGRIAQSAREKREIRETGALAVEMEAAGAALAAEELNVGFYCIRAVSDVADEDFANDFNKFLMTSGRIHVPRLILNAFRSPAARLGELFRLSRRAALASNNLGDFLANCTY